MKSPLPALGPTEARELAALAEEEYHLPPGILFENAGRALAALVRRVAGRSTGRAVVLAGKGGNGGVALACARHLLNSGWDVEIVLAAPSATLAPATWLEEEMAKAAGARVRDARTEEIGFESSHAIVDGLLGYNGRGEPRPPMPGLIRAANAVRAKRVSIDVPTGVDAETGSFHGEPFRADATLMIGLPKKGSVTHPGRGAAGALWLADGGFPRAAYAKVEAARPEFTEAGLLELD